MKWPLSFINTCCHISFEHTRKSFASPPPLTALEKPEPTSLMMGNGFHPAARCSCTRALGWCVQRWRRKASLLHEYVLWYLSISWQKFLLPLPASLYSSSSEFIPLCLTVPPSQSRCSRLSYPFTGSTVAKHEWVFLLFKVCALNLA